MFLNHLYGGIDEPELKIIDVFVCKLRKKLMEVLGGECYIETIWGRGYTLKDVPPVEDNSGREKASKEDLEGDLKGKASLHHQRSAV